MAMQVIDALESRSEDGDRLDAGRASGSATAGKNPLGGTPPAESCDTQKILPLAASMRDGRLSLRGRMLLLALLPATVCSLSLWQLARVDASWPLYVLGTFLLAGMGAAYGLFETRRFLQPIQMMIGQSDRLSARYCGQLPGGSRNEVFALAKSFDAMTAALLTYAESSRQMYVAEAQNAIDLQREYALMQMLRNLASAANSGEPLETALQNSLREVGSYLDWPIGRLVLVVHKKSGEIESERSYWYAPDPKRFCDFVEACDQPAAGAESTGLIGRAEESHLSHWVCDLGRMNDWSRREVALACGLRTGFVIPINAGSDTTAFMEFFTDHRIEAGAEMLELVEAISVELWNTANRFQADSSLRSPSARARRLASIAESMEEAIALTDASGRIEWANGGLTRLVGFNAAQLIGKNLTELLFATDSTSASECRRHMESGIRTVGEVLAAHTDAGDVRWFELEFQPLSGGRDEPGAVFVVVRDVTKQQVTQIALSEALGRARRGSQSRPQFLADLSRGLRAPMNQVLGIADLLLKSQLDERQRGLVGSLNRSVEAFLNILNDMLDLSKIESGQMKLEVQDFDPGALIENLLGRAAPLAHAKGIELVCQLSPKLPAMVRGDPARLRQILNKLLHNALKFTERGEVAVTVETLGEHPQSRYGASTAPIRFEVRDTGTGMRPQILEKIFVTPIKGDCPPPDRPGDIGLGLTLCRRLAELMEGSIGASSRIGEGSTFYLEVPLALGDCSANALPVDGSGSFTGRRVLIAEDNPTNRRILCEQLTALNMDCALAENGRQALQMLRIAANSASPFDIAVVDMKMPFMDGAELTEKIRSDPSLRPLRVIMLTSLSGCADAGHVPSAGVDAYLLKPVRHQDLVAALTAATGTAPSTSGGTASVAPSAGLAPVALPVVDGGRRSEPGNPTLVTIPSPRKVLEKRVLDEIALMERDGASGLLRRLVATYETSSRSLVQATDLNLANRDGSGAAQALHTLKLSSANLGALRFSRACGEIETLARQQRLADAQLRWPAIRAEHERVLLALQALFSVGIAADADLQELGR